jgi:hypothetical protein
MKRIAWSCAAALVACGGAASPVPQSEGSGPVVAPTSGPAAPAAASRSHPIAVRLVDAPADLAEVVVTILRVEAETEGVGWTVLSSEARRVDLLKLRHGVYATLGGAPLPVGRIGQLRLYVDPEGDNHVTTTGGERHALKVPSGVQSGIKLVGGFDVGPCHGGSLTIDFDADRSVVRPGATANAAEDAGAPEPQSKRPDAGGPKTKGAPSSPEYVLKPVLKVAVVDLVDVCADAGVAADDAAPVEPIDGDVDPAPPSDAASPPAE